MNAPGADAELIQVCDRFAEIELKIKAQYVEIKHEAEQDRARKPLLAELHAIRELLELVPDPSTLAGARALARAAMASAPVTRDGEAFFEGGDAEWLGFVAAEFLATHDDPVPIPMELAMLRQLAAMGYGAAITWMGAAMLVFSGQSAPDDAYAGWVEKMTDRAPA